MLLVSEGHVESMSVERLFAGVRGLDVLEVVSSGGARTGAVVNPGPGRRVSVTRTPELGEDAE
jgi:hypothetical protein